MKNKRLNSGSIGMKNKRLNSGSIGMKNKGALYTNLSPMFNNHCS